MKTGLLMCSAEKPKRRTGHKLLFVIKIKRENTGYSQFCALEIHLS